MLGWIADPRRSYTEADFGALLGWIADPREAAPRGHCSDLSLWAARPAGHSWCFVILVSRFWVSPQGHEDNSTAASAGVAGLVRSSASLLLCSADLFFFSVVFIISAVSAASFARFYFWYRVHRRPHDVNLWKVDVIVFGQATGATYISRVDVPPFQMFRNARVTSSASLLNSPY